MANQTEDSNGRKVKNGTVGIARTRNPLSSSSRSSHNTVVDHNNNVQSQSQPTVTNFRKRSSDDGPSATALGFIKRFKVTLGLGLFLAILPPLRSESPDLNSVQNWDRPAGMPKIAQLEVMCGAQHMEVHLNFDAPFHGLVASKGMYGQPGCVYVPPRTGRTSFVFNIYYDKCGTKPDNHGKFYENTVVVQFDEELIEAWDEAKRLRCEWFNDYEKTATKTSPMVISDLDIVELNFHGDNVDCWMEIQEGKGPWAPPLNGIVPLGSPLTMVVAVKDPTGEFDMRVKACEASDGQGGHLLPLSDADGCIVRPKLLGKFSKMRIDDGKATVLTYAYINAFKFPDMLNVHLRCTVEICRHGCPAHCSSQYQLPPHGHHSHGPSTVKTVSSNFLEPMAYESQNLPTFGRPNALHEEKPRESTEPPPQPVQLPPQAQTHAYPPQLPEPYMSPPPSQNPESSPSVSMSPPQPMPSHFHRQPHQRPQRLPGPVKNMRQGHGGPRPGMVPGKFHPRKFPPPPGGNIHRQGLAHGESESEKVEGQSSGDPRALKDDQDAQPGTEAPPKLEESKAQAFKEEKGEGIEISFKGPRQLTIRKRRSVSSSSDVIGIEGGFRVISQADLDFALNLTSTPRRPQSVPILRGRMNGSETIYGSVCLPRLGFGIVFFGLGLATLVAVLIASFFAYAHYRSTNITKTKSMSPGVMTVSDVTHDVPSHQLQHPLFPMVILRNFW